MALPFYDVLNDGQGFRQLLIPPLKADIEPQVLPFPYSAIRPQHEFAEQRQPQC